MRWIVGDIHGCLEQLDRLLETAGFRPGRDELWSSGDMIGRGPDPVGVLHRVRELGGRAVIGNHEFGAFMTWAGLREKRSSPLEPLYTAPDADELFRWIRDLPALTHLAAENGGRDAWLVHGGIRPYWGDLQAVADRLNRTPRPLDAFRSDELMFAAFARCCTPEGGYDRFSGCPDDCPEGTRPWDDFYNGEDLIVHGHWGMRGHYRSRNVIGLDSGCVYGGRLTAWCQEDDRIVQVPGRTQNR